MAYHQENRKAKIVVAGNATSDAFILGTTEISEDGSSVLISSGTKNIDFQVDDPPIRKGHKHRVGQALEERIQGLWHMLEPGGGGYNSVIAMRNCYSQEELELVYLDVSTPTKLVTQKLNVKDVRSHFFCERPVPLNVILNGREDKITLKGPHLGRYSPSRSEMQEAEVHINDSDAVLINSVKDVKYVEGYTEIAQKYNIPLYFVVSTSLDQDFVEKKVLPTGVSIINYDDLIELYSRRELVNPQEKMGYALETIRRIRKDGINSDKNIYVTLGKNGVYCSDKDLIFHVRLNDIYLERVQQAISKNPESTNGAGDVFSASIVLQEILRKESRPITDIAREACEASIKFIGYNRHLPKKAFIISTV